MKVIAPGEIVTEPGQYDIPMSWYHSQCTAGPSVSSSGLRKIYHESPAEFWCRSDLNDERLDEEDNEHFALGRAAHALILGDAAFDDEFVILPDTAPAKPTKAQIAAREAGRVSDIAAERFAFWDEFSHRNAAKTILSATDMDHVYGMSKSLRAHALVPLLLEGEPEQSLIWQDRTGLWLKSRLDMLSKTSDLVDLKSTSQNNPRQLRRDILYRGYDMQVGLATMGLEQVLGIPFTPEAYEGRAGILIFVYKQPPYHVMPIEVSYDALHLARIKVRSAIDTMAKCIAEERWPGPVEGILTYDVDVNEAHEIGEKQAAGVMPLSAD